MAFDSILKTQTSNRIYGLDILRAYAIITVLLGHITEYIPLSIRSLYGFLMFDGVGVFFVLSGFLIGKILLKSFDKEGISFTSVFKFWLNRWLRTVPPYLFVLILLLIITYVFDMSFAPYFMGEKAIAKYFFFLQDIVWPHFGFFSESWSLTVEEWFYLLTPIFIFICSLIYQHNIKKSVITTICIFIILGIVFRTYREINIEQGFYDYLKFGFPRQVLFRIDSIMFGVCGAFIYYYYNSFWIRVKYPSFILFFIILVLLSFMPRASFYSKIFSDTIFSFAVLCSLPFMNSIQKKNNILYYIITYVSLISYSMYLLHYTFIKDAIIEHISNNYYELSNPYKISIYFILTFLLATLMYLFIERPSMNLRKKIKFNNFQRSGLNQSFKIK